MTSVEEWHRHREQGTTIREATIADATWQHADLARVRIDRVTLRDVDLRTATLSEGEWLDCTLSDVRMGAAVGRGAIFRMCTFERVQASDCDLSGIKLENSAAHGIVLDRANLSGGSLIDSDLTRASLRGADLRDVDASGAILRGADLRGADLRGASLADADLRGADLRGALLDDAALQGADVRGVLLDGGDPDDPFEFALPPGVAEITDVVGPLLAQVFERGHERGVVDEATLERLVAELGRANPEAAPRHTALDASLQQIVERVSKTGLAPLLGSLAQRGPAPPPEIAQLIHTLMADAELGPEATAEDLLVHLAGQVRGAFQTK